MQPCADPDCEYPANPDPSISDGFCCEKCEGRFNGEEWANSGKKKHTAYCTSKDESLMGMTCAPASAFVGGARKGSRSNSRKCANPECTYMKHSDPSYSKLYCCEKCEGVHQGADWAEGGKKHYKHCEKIEASESGGGYGGGGGFGCGCGAGAYGKAAGGKGTWVQLAGPYGAFGGKAMGGGAYGKGCGKATPWTGPISPISNVSGLKKAGGKAQGKAKATGPSLKDFETDQKVWVGNLPEGADLDEIKEHFGLMGGTVKFAAMLKGGTCGVAFETAEQAAEAVIVLNNSGFGDNAIQVDVWTGK